MNGEGKKERKKQTLPFCSLFLSNSLFFFFFLFEETIDDDQADHNGENDERPAEKNDLRISQPKYSQLLKGLDFSRSRMVNRHILRLFDRLELNLG